MKIIKLIEEIKSVERLVFNASKFDNILFTSEHNSEGKTTAMRSIVFCLGFDVNIISDIYDDLKPKLTLSVDFGEGIFDITRTISQEHLIFLHSKEGSKMFDLRNEEEADIFSKLIGFESYDLMNSMLGAFYVDQDFGWKYINHGRIHPNKNMNFKFNSVLSTLVAESSWKEVNGMSEELSALNKEITVIKKLSTLDIKPVNLDIGDKIQMRKISNLSTKLDNIENKIKTKKALDDDFKKFFTVLANNSVINNIVGSDKKLILSKIRDFENELSDQEIKSLEFTRKQTKKELESLKNKLNNTSTLFSQGSKNLLKNALSIAVTLEDKDSTTIISAELDGLETRKSAITKHKKKIDARIFEIKKSYYNQVVNFIERITGTKTKITQSKLFSDGTSADFDHISGAKKAFFVLILRYLLISLYRRKTGVALPLMIDTPSTFDPANESVAEFMTLLKSVSRNHQIISAGVNKEVNKEIGSIGNTKIEEIKSNFKTLIDSQDPRISINDILVDIENNDISLPEDTEIPDSK